MTYDKTTMHKQNSTGTGFTIVELLIVIVVIAILAAISVVAYTGIQNRANNAIVEADIASITKKMELVRVDLGRYPQSAAEFPDGFKFSKSAYDGTQNNIYYVVDIQNDRYAFGLRSKAGRGYILNTGTTTAGVSVNGQATADALGITWANAPGVSYVYQGYVGSSGNWSTGWGWTN